MVDKSIIHNFFQWRKVEFPPELVSSLEWQVTLYQAMMASYTLQKLLRSKKI